MKCPKCESENTDTARFCSDCGTSLTPVEEAQPSITKTIETPREELTTGSTFAGRYQIIEELGKGGMGKVYRVLDKKLNEEVALKLIKPDIASDKNTIERFKNELRLARKIRQKNVGSMYELLEDKGIHFITMEYVSGQDLKGLMKQTGQLTVGKAISIAKQICDGLSEAHSLGVVHRDLKPNNIMIDRGGNAKIMDFGIARVVTGKGITGPGVMIGTPQYMSPEQVEGKEVDQRSDTYSLGIILYEMLTDKVPFDGDTPLTVGVKQKTETPEDPKNYNERIPDDLNRVVLNCLEKEKEKRYQTADEVKSELEKIEKGLPTSDRVVPKKEKHISSEMTVKLPFKRVLIPVLALIVIVITGLLIWNPWQQTISSPSLSEKPSIAVLPFEDLSSLKDQESFCDGLAISIINALSNLNELSVRARNSSFSFKGKGLGLQEIGARLNVETILAGYVQREGDRLRLTVQLNNVSDESLLWSKQYNQKLDDVFDIQDEIALKIIENLEVELLGREKDRLLKRHTENMQAFNHYTNGLFWWNKRTGEGLRKAIDYFEMAVEEDPNYSLAYVGLADCYNLLNFYADIPPRECFPKAREAAEKALEIDDMLGEAHNSLGYYKERYEWDIPGAEKEFKRAIELNPNYATGHFWYGELLLIAGRFDEAVVESKIALDLDPISMVINAQLGWTYLNAGALELARAQCQKAIEMDPSFGQARFIMGIVHLKEKKYEDAIARFIEARELLSSANSLSYLGYAYTKNNQYDEARNILAEMQQLAKEKYIAPFFMCPIYVGLGEHEKALDFLEKAYEERNEFIVFLYSDELAWMLAPLFSHPRYQSLLKKVGFR